MAKSMFSLFKGENSQFKEVRFSEFCIKPSEKFPILGVEPCS